MANAILKYLFTVSVWLLAGAGHLSANSTHVVVRLVAEQSVGNTINDYIKNTNHVFAGKKHEGEWKLPKILRLPFFEESEETLNTAFKSPLSDVVFVILWEGPERSVSHTAIDICHPGIISDRYLLFEVFRI